MVELSPTGSLSLVNPLPLCPTPSWPPLIAWKLSSRSRSDGCRYKARFVTVPSQKRERQRVNERERNWERDRDRKRERVKESESRSIEGFDNLRGFDRYTRPPCSLVVPHTWPRIKSPGYGLRPMGTFPGISLISSSLFTLSALEGGHE